MRFLGAFEKRRVFRLIHAAAFVEIGDDHARIHGINFRPAIRDRYRQWLTHKLAGWVDQFGVSGCTRECAEAQGKDIGVIATDKGWNLYVCGNGGMKPRHADLFASDLDEATLIRSIAPWPSPLRISPIRRAARSLMVTLDSVISPLRVVGQGPSLDFFANNS